VGTRTAAGDWNRGQRPMPAPDTPAPTWAPAPAAAA